MSALQTHSHVWRAFRYSPDERRTAIAEGLNRLRLLRNAADYDGVLAEDPRSTARDAVNLAPALLRALDEARSAPG